MSTDTQQLDLEAALTASGRIRRLLETLHKVDPCAAVWAAAQCLRQVLDLIPAEETRPFAAIIGLEEWTKAPTPLNQRVLWLHRRCLAEATRELNCAIPRRNCDSLSAGEKHKAQYALYAAAAVWDAYDLACKGSSGRIGSSFRCALRQDPKKLESLVLLIRDSRWDLTQPTAEQILCASDPMAVAWDRVMDTTSDTEERTITMQDLIRAEDLCTSRRLSWAHPFTRAICERLILSKEDPRVIELLRSCPEACSADSAQPLSPTP